MFSDSMPEGFHQVEEFDFFFDGGVVDGGDFCRPSRRVSSLRRTRVPGGMAGGVATFQS